MSPLTRPGSRRYGDPRRSGRPGPRRAAATATPAGGYVAGVVLAALGLAVAGTGLVGVRRADEEFTSVLGYAAVGSVALVFFVVAALCVAPARHRPTIGRWLDVVLILPFVVLALSLLLAPADFSSPVGGLRNPDTPWEARLVGAAMIVTVVVAAFALVRRRR